MSERELRQLFMRHSRDLDARQRARIRQIRGVERDLFEALVRKLVDVLDQGDGVINTRKGSASMNELVDQVFRAMERAQLGQLYKDATQDLFAILGNNDSYNEVIAKEMGRTSKRFKAIRETVDRTMRGKLGIDDKGRVKPSGALGKLFRGEAMRNAVKEALNAGMVSGKPVSLLVRELEVTIKGTRLNRGALERQLTPLVFDTYQQFDRASNDAYATRIGLDTFIYVGGLIETSREFCRKHDGKVFTVEEANEQWPKDSDLPRSKAEKDSGTLVGYNPTVDLGRWQCRHRTRYISRPLAERMRPDLKP